MEKIKIYIVEDDEVLFNLLKEELVGWGYAVVGNKSFVDIDQEVLALKPHLILMDVNLPSYNGYYWCHKIREKTTVPLIFISSRNTDIDTIQAMQVGGDDFVTKPFNLMVLNSKIKAILRRSYNYQKQNNYLIFNNINLFLDSATLLYNDNEISLTRTELLILECLFKASGKIVSREKLMDFCWQTSAFIDDNTLAVNLTRLRKKLQAINLSGLIQNKKGLGYYLDVRENSKNSNIS